MTGESSAALTATFETHRPWLISIAYRMLGSAADAEDIVQETCVRYLQTQPGAVGSTKAFLATIVTRLSINHLKSARVRREHYVGTWLPEPVFTDQAADPQVASEQNDSVRLAFLVVLESLTPVERAVLLLRDVFSYEYGEIAKIIGKSDASCRQHLHRARRHVAERRRKFPLTALSESRVLERFVAATTRGRVDDLVSLLAADVVLWSDGGGAVVAARRPIRGRDRVVPFLIGALQKLVPNDVVIGYAEINGQRAVVNYRQGVPYSALVLEATAGELVQSIFIIVNPEKLRGLADAARVLR